LTFNKKISKRRRGQKLPLLGETLPKKHHKNPTLKDSKFEEFITFILKINLMLILFSDAFN